MLDASGLTEEKIAQVHLDNLAAEKTIAVARNNRGEITEVRTAPDHATRQRAVADAWRIRGRLGAVAEEDGDRGQPLQVNILYQTAKKVERLVGRKIIPDEWQERVESGEDGERAAAAVLPAAPEAQPVVAGPRTASPEPRQADGVAEDDPLSLLAAEW